MIDLAPHAGGAYATIAVSEVQQGRLTQAVADAEKATQVDDSLEILAEAGGVYGAAGQKEKARQVLATLEDVSRRRYVCGYEVGIVYLNLGDKDEAFRWLEKGFRDRSACMPYTKVDPRLDPLRSDPRYADLVRRIGFPR